MRKKVDEKVTGYKILFTILTIFIYICGRNIPLLGVEVSDKLGGSMAIQDILNQTISGDRNRTSIFALGVSPYMLSSIFVQMSAAFRSSDNRTKMSQLKLNRSMLILSVLIATFEAVTNINNLAFGVAGGQLVLFKVIVVIEMIAGSVYIIWLAERNGKYGIGGQSALIFVNMCDSLYITIKQADVNALVLPISISVVIAMIMLFMENKEVRIPVQRILVHNIYADKNYIAIKYNPIGVMPVMFASGFFMLPQYALSALNRIFPSNSNIIYFQNQLSLSKYSGIIFYIAILVVLSIIFSNVMVNPTDIAEQLLKNGDSIVNVRAGKETSKYIYRIVYLLSFISAFIMGLCLLVPMLLQLKGEYDSGLLMLPAAVMMLVGIGSNLYREFTADRRFDSYKIFL